MGGSPSDGASCEATDEVLAAGVETSVDDGLPISWCLDRDGAADVLRLATPSALVVTLDLPQRWVLDAAANLAEARSARLEGTDDVTLFSGRQLLVFPGERLSAAIRPSSGGSTRVGIHWLMTGLALGMGSWTELEQALAGAVPGEGTAAQVNPDDVLASAEACFGRGLQDYFRAEADSTEDSPTPANRALDDLADGLECAVQHAEAEGDGAAASVFAEAVEAMVEFLAADPTWQAFWAEPVTDDADEWVPPADSWSLVVRHPPNLGAAPCTPEAFAEWELRDGPICRNGWAVGFVGDCPEDVECEGIDVFREVDGTWTYVGVAHSFDGETLMDSGMDTDTAWYLNPFGWPAE